MRGIPSGCCWWLAAAWKPTGTDDMFLVRSGKLWLGRDDVLDWVGSFGVSKLEVWTLTSRSVGVANCLYFVELPLPCGLVVAFGSTDGISTTKAALLF